MATQDRFANVVAASVTLSAANTLTFSEVQLGIGLAVRMGIIIDAIDYFLDPTMLGEMTTALDRIDMAWCANQNVTSLIDVSDRRIIYSESFTRVDLGVAASGVLVRNLVHRDFAPPLIFAAPTMHLACVTAGLASAALLRSRLYFRYQALSAEEYLELAEAFQISS